MTTADGRTIPVRVWSTTAADGSGRAGRVPLVVFSHGGGGSAHTYDFFGEIWSAAGFVAAFPTHHDSLAAAHASGVSRADALSRMYHDVHDPEAWRRRVHDVSAVLDAAQDGRGSLAGTAIDLKRCAVAGHSFGAFTAMLAAGVTPENNGQRMDERDDRFTDALLLSAQGVGEMGMTAASFSGLIVPTDDRYGGSDSATGCGAANT